MCWDICVRLVFLVLKFFEAPNVCTVPYSRIILWLVVDFKGCILCVFLSALTRVPSVRIEN